jgi:hypothetical protein
MRNNRPGTQTGWRGIRERMQPRRIIYVQDDRSGARIRETGGAGITSVGNRPMPQ